MFRSINGKQLMLIVKKYNTILLVYENENQLLKMMKAQLNKIRKIYNDEFKYYLIHRKDIENILKSTISTFPQLVIMEKDKVVAFMYGFRQIKEVIKTIEFNFRLSLCKSIKCA